MTESNTTENNVKGERIAKIIAASGFCSRRKAEGYIESGSVKVNGEVINTPIYFVKSDDDITINGEKITPQKNKEMWLLNKPEGYLCTRDDPHGRNTIYDLLPEEMANIHYIGRLDMNSEGLILLTNSADVKRFYEHPENKIERVYLVKVYGKFDDEIIRKSAKGFSIYDKDAEKKMLYNAKIEPHRINKDSRNNWLKFTLKEGKNREIRRICEHFSYQVSKLKRISFGEFELENLERGKFIKL